MNVARSSSSSIVSDATLTQNDLANDSSNLRYENRDHFQSIFTNDSRFFDTSLHLFKSYAALGYIQSNTNDNKNIPVPILTTESHGRRHRMKARLLNLTNNPDTSKGALKDFLTPTLLRKTDNSDRNRSNSTATRNGTKDHPQKSAILIQYKQPSNHCFLSSTRQLSLDKESQFSCAAENYKQTHLDMSLHLQDLIKNRNQLVHHHETIGSLNFLTGHGLLHFEEL
ncbi:unnamed protein product [Rotaria magnacalcarata]|uniref:Uncharacterized protein n=1 Tax=Rotaria magnacalcarata TaxID=392030 RepID=A0A819MPA8_9BILA|nr:unnamed protein product [Rotaria magnacalcarata]CAF3981946.1 unnamed protein product [Rotaria magnacalcarata]CAF3981948.1 unnamed protein product [Rotaria magnacalcarata]CAF4030992.1 unnamed protein product [Rotaria magnacalcarata]